MPTRKIQRLEPIESIPEIGEIVSYLLSRGDFRSGTTVKVVLDEIFQRLPRLVHFEAMLSEYGLNLRSAIATQDIYPQLRRKVKGHRVWLSVELNGSNLYIFHTEAAPEDMIFFGRKKIEGATRDTKEGRYWEERGIRLLATRKVVR